MPILRGFGSLSAIPEEKITDKITRRVLAGEKSMMVWSVSYTHLDVYKRQDQMGHAQQSGTEPVGDPDVALAVDVKTAVVDPGLEGLDLARILSLIHI